MPRMVLTLALTVALSLVAHAQQPAVQRLPGTMGVDEATSLTQGWALLAQGLFDDAVRQAELVAGQFPTSPSALALLVETHLAKFGAVRALDRYEQWLGNRTLEPAHVLRQVARAVLWDVASRQSGQGRIDALTALVADGDGLAATELSKGLDEDRIGDVQAMAALGSVEAVRRLAERVAEPTPNRVGQIKALGASRSAAAVQVLLTLLNDTRDEVRIASAESLAALGAREAIEPLKQMLTGQTLAVRIGVAAALYRLDDLSGYELLQKMLYSEEPGVRIGVAVVMAPKPDPAWLDIVRALARETDPSIRLQAAQLLVSQDPEAARAVMEQLALSDNPAIREQAARTIARALTADFRQLRVLLRSTDGETMVAAASRILILTR